MSKKGNHRSCIQYVAENLVPTNLNHVLEFGVASGKSIAIISKALKGKDYEIYGFDSFEGLPSDWIDIHGKVVAKRGRFSTEGNIPNVSGVKFLKGWFKDTIPQYLPLAKNIALLHIDCDLYQSGLDVLYGVQNYIVAGTVIVFDEWVYCHNSKYNDGTQKAFYEWVEEKTIQYEFLSFPGDDIPNIEQKVIRIL